MNNRRKLLVVLGAASFVPLEVFAQAKQPTVIGWLQTGSRESAGRNFALFKEGLATLGWKEGTQFVIVERWADGIAVDKFEVAEAVAGFDASRG